MHSQLTTRTNNNPKQINASYNHKDRFYQLIPFDCRCNDGESCIEQKGCAGFLSRRESISGKVRLLFPKKIQPCLTRDSNPNPLDYKPSDISTILGGAALLPVDMQFEIPCFSEKLKLSGS
ncbi:hypothetical protein TNCV_4621861 [Trichonephila clavipes]|nr:hypothetical protein TNCV_4621861 [Trichonephila clavipes]